MNNIAYYIDPNELFLLLAAEDYGTEIFVDRNGTLTTGRGPFFVGKAKGEFTYADWSIHPVDNGFAVEGLEGVFDSDIDALKASMKTYGNRKDDSLTNWLEERMDEQADESNEYFPGM